MVFFYFLFIGVIKNLFGNVSHVEQLYFTRAFQMNDILKKNINKLNQFTHYLKHVLTFDIYIYILFIFFWFITNILLFYINVFFESFNKNNNFFLKLQYMKGTECFFIKDAWQIILTMSEFWISRKSSLHVFYWIKRTK